MSRSEPRACGLTAYPAISGMRQLRRVVTPSWSKTTPPPTSMKSDAQASVILALTLNSAASRWLTTILRPLMPPAALHHFAKTVAVSKSSWFRPGRPANPGSDNVPILISLGVTPWAGEPDALPFLQTTSLVPNARVGAPPDVLAACAVVLLVPPDLSS